MHYTGKLLDGTIFDSSYDRKPFQFTVGTSQVIPGWQKAIKQMQVGQTAFVVVPPEMAYGKKGLGDMVPPNATLVFKIQVLGIAGEKRQRALDPLTGEVDENMPDFDRHTPGF